jgi:hypothetical protein
MTKQNLCRFTNFPLLLFELGFQLRFFAGFILELAVVIGSFFGLVLGIFW